MQILPTSLNAATAASIPSVNPNKVTANRENAAQQIGVEKVEHGEQTQDRDANEQYVGGRHGGGRNGATEEGTTPEDASPSLLQLEVSDDEAPPLLDISV